MFSRAQKVTMYLQVPNENDAKSVDIRKRKCVTEISEK